MMLPFVRSFSLSAPPQGAPDNVTSACRDFDTAGQTTQWLSVGGMICGGLAILQLSAAQVRPSVQACCSVSCLMRSCRLARRPAMLA